MAHSLSFPSNTTISKRRPVFNGNQTSLPAGEKSQTNKKVGNRRWSPLTLFIVIIAAASISVTFIWNKIAVNDLAKDVHKLQMQYEAIAVKNEVLRAEIHQKSRLDFIEKTAQEKLGLIYPKEQPVYFDLERN